MKYLLWWWFEGRRSARKKRKRERFNAQVAGQRMYIRQKELLKELEKEHPAYSVDLGKAFDKLKENL